MGNTFTGYVSADGTNWTQIGFSASVHHGQRHIRRDRRVCSAQHQRAERIHLRQHHRAKFFLRAARLAARLDRSSRRCAGGAGFNSVSSAASYNVKSSTNNNGPYVIITNVTGVAFTNIGLVNGATYYYVTSATNSAGESADSVPVSARPLSSSAPQLRFHGQCRSNSIYLANGSSRLGIAGSDQCPEQRLGPSNWVTLASSDTTNLWVIPLNTGNGSVFFRLVHP